MAFPRLRVREDELAEVWRVFLGTCCEECARGNTWDCDVNPLRIIATREDAAVMLTNLGEAP